VVRANEDGMRGTKADWRTCVPLVANLVALAEVPAAFWGWRDPVLRPKLRYFCGCS
jgi:hypothetical protein